jgi:plastocyanin
MNNLSCMRKNAFLFLCIALFSSCSTPAEKIPDEDTTAKQKTYAVYIVEIKQMKFEPADLKAHIGDTVLFVNQDLVDHDVTEEKTKAWSSSPLGNEKFWKMVITDSTHYYCALHPVMKGKISIE